MTFISIAFITITMTKRWRLLEWGQIKCKKVLLLKVTICSYDRCVIPSFFPYFTVCLWRFNDNFLKMISIASYNMSGKIRRLVFTHIFKNERILLPFLSVKLTLSVLVFVYKLHVSGTVLEQGTIFNAQHPTLSPKPFPLLSSFSAVRLFGKKTLYR